MDHGPWTMDRGLWTVDRGLWTVDRGSWTVDSGPWTVDHGPWTCHTTQYDEIILNFPGQTNRGSLLASKSLGTYSTEVINI